MSPIPFTSPLMTETVAIESSSLSKVAYHHQRAILQVEFRDGTIYHYLKSLPGRPPPYLSGSATGRLKGRVLQSSHSKPLCSHPENKSRVGSIEQPSAALLNLRRP
jgi:hypothetical protein